MSRLEELKKRMDEAYEDLQSINSDSRFINEWEDAEILYDALEINKKVYKSAKEDYYNELNNKNNE